MNTPIRPRRRYAIPVAAIAAIGVAGGAFLLSGCGEKASAGSTAASVAGYVSASSPVYVQVSTDTTGPQWTQLIDLAEMFPGYSDMQKQVEQGLASEGISWEKDLQPLLGEAAALATTDLPDAAAAKGAGPESAGATGRRLAAAADQSVLAVLQIAEGKSDQVAALLTATTSGGLKATGDYSGATLFSDPQSGMYAAVTPDALIIGSSVAMVKQAIDAHGAGGDRVISGVPRFNEALALLPKDTFAIAYVNIEALGKSAATALPTAENIVGGQITGAAAMSVTAEKDGLRLKAVLVDGPPITDQKQFAPTLTQSVPADAVAYLGFNNLAGTVQQMMDAASGGASGDMKTQIDALTAQVPLLLGVSGADLTNLTGGELAVVVADGTPTPSVSLALKTADGKQAETTLTTLSKRVPTLLSQFGPKALKKAGTKGFTTVNLGGVKGHRLAIGTTGDLVWGVKGDLAVISSQASGAASLLAPTGASLASSVAFTAATQGMPDKVTGLAWINVPQAMPLLAAQGAFAGTDGARTRKNLSHISGIAAWGAEGTNPTFEVFLGLKK